VEEKRASDQMFGIPLTKGVVRMVFDQSAFLSHVVVQPAAAAVTHSLDDSIHFQFSPI
jgi:hypothetical protein